MSFSDLQMYTIEFFFFFQALVINATNKTHSGYPSCLNKGVNKRLPTLNYKTAVGRRSDIGPLERL